MEQKHTEQSIDHNDGEQNTGNHKKPGAPDAGGADRFGGTRTEADNLEPVAPEKDARGRTGEGSEQPFDQLGLHLAQTLGQAAPAPHLEGDRAG